jgi:hypothetical protein
MIESIRSACLEVQCFAKNLGIVDIDLEDNSVFVEVKGWTFYTKHKEGEVFGGVGFSTPSNKFYDIGFL